MDLSIVIAISASDSLSDIWRSISFYCIALYCIVLYRHCSVFVPSVCLSVCLSVRYLPCIIIIIITRLMTHVKSFTK